MEHHQGSFFPLMALLTLTQIMILMLHYILAVLVKK